jgi:alpha-L-fucosidase
MAKIGSPDVGFFLIGGFDLLGVSVTAFNFKHMAEVEEETGSGDGDEVWAAVGLSRGELSLSGFYEDAAGKSDAALISTGSDRVVLIGHEGNTIGKIAQGFAGAVEGVYNRVLELAKLHKANANFKMNGPIERHRILHAHTTESAASGDTESTSVDNAASSADGGAGILQVEDLTLGGYTDVTIKVRDSTDDIVFADLITFTNVTIAKTALRAIVAGTVNRYLASSWLFNGAGGGQSIKFAVGFARG